MIRNKNVAEAAAIDSVKVEFGRTTVPTTADIAGTSLTGRNILWYDSTNQLLKVVDDGVDIALAEASSSAGTLQSAYVRSNIINDMSSTNAVEINPQSTDNLTQVFVLDNDDTTGNPVVLTIENAGTGNDITASAFAVTKAGAVTATGLTMVDAKVITLGTGSDFTIQCDASNILQFDAVAKNRAIYFGASNNVDVRICADTATDYVEFDTDDSAKVAKFEDFKLRMMDDTVLEFGDDIDFNVQTDGTDLLIDGGTADTEIKIGATTNHDLGIYGATATDFVLFDTDDSAKQIICEDFHILLMDDTELRIGDSADVTVDWKAAGGLYLAVVADNSVINVGDGTLSADLKWWGGDSSTYMYFNADGGSGTTGEFAFGVDNHGIDVKLYGATASAYALWDESADQFLFSGGATIDLQDDVELLLGTGASNAGDFKVYGSGTGPVLVINSVTAETGSIAIGADDYGLDMTWYGATASAGFLFDASSDQLISLAGASINMIDDDEIRFGTGASGGAGDLKLSSNSSNVLQLEQVATTVGTFEIGVNDKGIDTKFYAEAASAYMLWDQNGNTNGELVFVGADVHMGDDDQVAWGASRDMTLDWKVGGGLYLEALADNSLLTVGDGTLSVDAKWFGGDAATYIYFDADGGTNSTGELKLGVDDHGIDVIFYGATASFNVTFDESGDEMIFSGGATPCYPRIPACTLQQIDAISVTGTAGQIAFISNGAAGSAILGFSDGSNWLRSDTGAGCAVA